jgi:hypothetical protein
MYVVDSAHPIVRCMISSNFHCHVNGRYVFPFAVLLIFPNCCFHDIHEYAINSFMFLGG